MHAGLPGGAGAPTGPLLLAAGLAVGAAFFFSDGSSYGSLAGIGSLVLALAGAGVVVAFAGLLPLPRLRREGALCLGLFAGLVVWMGLSVLWSVAPDLSWNYFNRGLVYLSFLVLGLLIGAGVARALYLSAVGLAALTALVVAWALAGKVVPNLFPDGSRLARLREPVGYWNSLGLIAVMALLLGVWLASRRGRHRWLRVGGTVLVFLATVTLLLTLSRGSTATAAVVVVAFIALTRERVPALAALALGAVPALAVASWAFTEDGLTADRQPYDVRLEAGLKLGVLLLLVGGAVAVVARRLLRSEDTLVGRLPRPSSRRLLSIGAVAMIAVALAVVLASGGDPGAWARRAADDFTTPATAEETERASRLGELSSNSRWDWWREAWDIFEANPVVGAGAGSFSIARRPIRRSTIDAKAPHSVPLQFLAETGLVGFLLLAGAVAAGIVAIARRTHTGDVTALVLALVALAYLLHSLVDYDWDFVAITGPVLLVVGVLLSAGRPTIAGRRRLLAGAVALVALVGVVSIASPWAAARQTDDAYEALARGDVSAAQSDAERARFLNPLALDPLRAEAAVAEAEGRGQDALGLYVKAVELQPENWQSWYELARFEQAVGLRDAATRHATRAAQLDPKNPIIFELINALATQTGP
jgi:type II secretory pathway component PulM